MVFLIILMIKFLDIKSFSSFIKSYSNLIFIIQIIIPNLYMFANGNFLLLTLRMI